MAPKNITTNNVKKGGVDKCLFSHPTYNACGEPFQEARYAMQTRKQNNAAILAAGHEKNFAPAKILKKNYKPPFEHMTDRREIVKNYRDEEGAVITAPRNFLTNPPKTGKVGR